MRSSQKQHVNSCHTGSQNLGDSDRMEPMRMAKYMADGCFNDITINGQQSHMARNHF